MMYYPEMDQKPAERLFKSNHVYGGSYDLTWSPERDEEARKVLSRLRIRPSCIELCRVGIELVATAKADRYSASVTSLAHSKLLKEDVVAHEMLLD